MSAPDDWEPDTYTQLHPDGEGLIIPLAEVAKDEWLYHLNERFHEISRGVSAATKPGAEGLRIEERWFNDGSRDLVRLRFINTAESLVVFLGTRDGGDNRAEADFRDALVYATESTGSRRVDVAWEATLCEVPARRGLRRSLPGLGTPVEANKLRIESWGSEHATEVSAWTPAMGFQRVPWHFWPIRVTGSVRCYAWEHDGIEVASARLRLVVEVLSLALNWPVEVRVGPYEASITIGGEEGNVVPGISAPIVPDDHPWKSDGTVDLPDWVLPVLNGRGLDDATVRRALSAHYEAMLLKADQPSMALLGFVASIESLAVPTKGLPRCPQCDMITGSGQRFRDALAKILSPEEIELVGKVYDHRSKTVHRGQLHASEDVLGMFPSQGFFSVDTRMLFEFGTVHLAGAASRDLLLARIAPEQSAPAEP